MASYFSSFTTRIAAVRQNLLPTEDDGPTEDDTHVCRVLRVYYTEKGRSFPAWLPPDPKAPPPIAITPAYVQSNVGSRYGAMNSSSSSNTGTNLSSLWDQQQAPQGQEGSLRPGASRFGSSVSAGGQGRQNPFSRGQQGQEREEVQARPLPSQRAGSYQVAGQQAGFGQQGMMSAKDRLAGRLGGNKGRAGGSMEAPRTQSYGGSAAAESGRGGGGGGEKPYMGSSSPWASGGGEQEAYAPPPRQAQGLPSGGPGAGRRGPGLPSGPRGMR